jgi:acyl-CoA synthetase (AMP-forming)/AMP-acid ligase II
MTHPSLHAPTTPDKIASCPVDIKARMIDWWGPILIEYYGGSEGNGVTVITSQEWLTHRGSVGRAVIGKVKILDEDDQALPVGEIGVVYSPMGRSSPITTIPRRRRAPTIRGAGPLLGTLDTWMQTVISKAYMIISGGVNIYPQETEDVLITHPAVADVAVFGVPSEEMGVEVKAVVQPLDMSGAGKELEAELIAFCRRHLSPVKCPRSVDFDRELPRTSTGKLLKRHLRDRYWSTAKKQTA